MQKISQNGKDLIKYFEGLRLASYKCAADVWTVGWGHTLTAGPNQRITRERAEQLLSEGLKGFEDAVNELVTVEID